MYICSLHERVVKDHDIFMIMFICICVCVCVLLFNRVIRNHSCGGMISYASEFHEELPGL